MTAKISIGPVVIVSSLLLLGWEITALLVDDEKLFPRILFVFSHSLPSFALFSDGSDPNLSSALTVLGKSTLSTIQHLVVGMALGLISAIVLQTLFFLIRQIHNFVDLLLLIVRFIPLLALIPLFLFWFGGSTQGIIYYIAFGTFAIAASILVPATRTIPEHFIDRAIVDAVPPMRQLTSLVLPATLPALLTSFRASLGLSWAFSLGGEYLVARSGLGHLVSHSYLHANMGRLLVLLLIYGSLGLLSFAVGNFFQKKFAFWVAA